jgi:hypothetical protein
MYGIKASISAKYRSENHTELSGEQPIGQAD